MSSGYISPVVHFSGASITIADYKKYFHTLVSETDISNIDTIFDRYDQFNSDKENAIFRIACHQIAHIIGHDLVDRYGIQEVIKWIPYDTCTGGFMHGAIEQAILTDNLFRQNPASICHTFRDKGLDNCTHGVGHGFMFLRSNSIDTSLQDCTVFLSLKDQISCARGVFMEYAIGETEHLIDAKKATTGDMREICSGLDDSDMISACAFYLPDRFFHLKGLDSSAHVDDEGKGYDQLSEKTAEDILAKTDILEKELINYCRSNTITENICIYSIAWKKVGYAMYSPQKIDTLCSSLGPELMISCYRGIVSGLRNRDKDEKYIHEKYCNQMPIGRPYCELFLTEQMLEGR